MVPRLSLLMLPLMLAACGGLSEEERQAAMGGALVPDAGAADRSASLSAEADARRRDAAEAAELARAEKAKAENERRTELVRLAEAQRARAEFPEGVERLVARGDEGPVLAQEAPVAEDDRAYDRWSAQEERRAQAMRERAQRYERRYEREARARERREDRLRERGYYEEYYAEERPMTRDEAQARIREMQRRNRETMRVEDVPHRDSREDREWRDGRR